jgi:hypothetical protein
MKIVDLLLILLRPRDYATASDLLHELKHVKKCPATALQVQEALEWLEVTGKAEQGIEGWRLVVKAKTVAAKQGNLF